MSLKVVSSFSTLMSLAAAEGRARMSGDQEALEKAQKAHEWYKKACLESDEMSLNVNYGDILKNS